MGGRGRLRRAASELIGDADIFTVAWQAERIYFDAHIGFLGGTLTVAAWALLGPSRRSAAGACAGILAVRRSRAAESSCREQSTRTNLFVICNSSGPYFMCSAAGACAGISAVRRSRAAESSCREQSTRTNLFVICNST